jgi:aryl-alcohol dehydrogenase-like predicted oxidoreductase
LTRPWEKKGGTERAGNDGFAKSCTARRKRLTKLVVERVTEVAQKRGVPQAQVALAWMLQKPFITSPIIGATKPQHLDDAVAALSVKLDDGGNRRVEEPYVPHPIVGFA